MNYAEVIDFVKEQTAVNGRPPNYPFRSRFEHTMRVYRPSRAILNPSVYISMKLYWKPII